MSDNLPIRDDNIILAMYKKGGKKEPLRLGLKPGNNVNGIIIGAAGMGKSFRFIKPNIMQLNSSYVITDPSGELFSTLSKMLLVSGYNVKLFSTSNMKSSQCYNPFDYVYNEEGEIDESKVSTMVNMFQKNAEGMQKANKGGDPFWEKSANALLTACAMYLLEFGSFNMRNFYHVLKLVQAGKANENSKGDEKTNLDKLFDEARKRNREAHCFSSYDTFKLAPAKTANSILISAGVDLNKFNQDAVRNMTTTAYRIKERNKEGKIIEYLLYNNEPIRTDENIDLYRIGDEPTALFVNTPQADPTFNFLVTMMYSQLFDVLYGRGEKLCPKRWLVMGADGRAALSMIKTEEEANRLKELYSNAEVQYLFKKKKEDAGWYIVNSSPSKDDKVYGLHGLTSKGKLILKKVYSEDVGERFIDNVRNGKVKFSGSTGLPWHVQFLLDEFANIGEIPEFPQKLATSRKYEISCIIVIQDISQLEDKYDKLQQTIFGNCSFTLFLGSPTQTTTEYISKMLGKRTTRVKSTSLPSAGGKGGGGGNIGLDGRELMMPDEVGSMPKDECLVIFSSEYDAPKFRVLKYNSLMHPNWKFHGSSQNPDWFIPVDTYSICSNKIMGSQLSNETKENRNKNVMAGRSPSGNPVMKSSSIKSREEVLSFFNLKDASPKDISKKLKPTTPARADEQAEGVSKSGKKFKVAADDYDVSDFEVPESSVNKNAG